MDEKDKQKIQEFENEITQLKKTVIDIKGGENPNQSNDFAGVVRIRGGELIVGGGVKPTPSSIQLPIVIVDDPGVTDGKNAFAYGMDIGSKSSTSESVVGIIGITKLKKEKASDSDGTIQNIDFSDSVDGGAQINIDNRYFDRTNYQTFFYGFRAPSASSTTGRITNAGSVLTDVNKSFAVNELAGAILNVYSDANSGAGESYLIASNTATTITISGTFAGSTGEYSYSVIRTIYFGSAQFPWRRLYTQDDIRFGIGASSGTNSSTVFIKQGNGSPEGSITANPGSLYLRKDGSTGTSLYIKESGQNTNTGWVAVSSLTAYSVIASENLKTSADTAGSSSSTTYEKKKEITVNYSGTITVKFDIQADGGAASYGRVYINGTAVGTEQTTSSSASYTTFSEDFTVSNGDKIQLYVHCTGGYTMSFKNFRIYCDLLPPATIVIN